MIKEVGEPLPQTGDLGKKLVDTIIALGFLEDFGGLPEAARLSLKNSLLDLKGDWPAFDITTLATIEADALSEARLVLKEPAVVAGLDLFALVLKSLDEKIEVEVLVQEGTYIGKEAIPQTVAVVKGHARTLLMGERLSLNLTQRMCGIATLTKKYTDKAGAKGIQILDTRKTTPGLRMLEKAAVKAAGGTNHRMGLYDAVLIKDNHIKAAGSITCALERVKAFLAANPQCKPRKIQVEVCTLEQLTEALDQSVEAVLLDNMLPALVAKAIEKISSTKKDCFVEVSGGVNLSNLDGYLIEGVTAISIGALTHSAANVDLSLEF